MNVSSPATLIGIGALSNVTNYREYYVGSMLFPTASDELCFWEKVKVERSSSARSHRVRGVIECVGSSSARGHRV